MNAEFEIVPFDKSHTPRAVEIYNHYVTTSTATFDLDELTDAEFNDRIVASDPPFGSFAIINKTTRIVVGYAIVGMYKPRPAYSKCSEVSVYLDPAHIRLGLGVMALETLHEFASEQKLHSLLGGLCTESTESINLFEKMGYERVAHLKEVGFKFDRWLDIYFYEKILD